MDEKMRESRLWEFGNVQRREINVPMRNGKLIQAKGTKKERNTQNNISNSSKKERANYGDYDLK